MLKNFIKKLISENYRLYIRSIFPSQEEKNIIKKRKSFYSMFLSEGDLYFDIGANVGNRIGPVLSLNAKVVAVEPQKNCCRYLKMKFGNQIQIVNKGINSSGLAQKMFISNSHTASSFSSEWINSMLKSKRFDNDKWEKSEVIEMTTLDNLIKQYGIPQFIKIDVEGYEFEVLKSLSEPINYISFEYAIPEALTNIISSIRRLNDVNKNTVFNYSVGETMALKLNKWIGTREMIELIQSEEFIKTGFGDIYAKRN